MASMIICSEGTPHDPRQDCDKCHLCTDVIVCPQWVPGVQGRNEDLSESLVSTTPIPGYVL